MFWIFKWALKNLYLNIGRSTRVFLLIFFFLSIILCNLTLLEGANRQMLDSIRNNQGDFYALSKNPVINLEEAHGLILSEIEGYLDGSVQIFTNFGNVVSSQSYGECTLNGVSGSFLEYLDKNVSWLEPPSGPLQDGKCFLDFNQANSLGLKKNDFLTVQINTQNGMINTVSLQVDGIFLGSNLLYNNVLYLSLTDMQNLFLLPGFFNQVKYYLNERKSELNLSALQSSLKKRLYFSSSLVFPILNPHDDLVFSVFVYYRLFLSIVFILMNIVFLIILFFSIQNIYYMDFRARRAEISTLLTYGMKPITLYSIVFFESLIIFVLSYLISALAVFTLTGILGGIYITDPNIADLIIALGGPRLTFRATAGTILAITLIVSILSISSTVFGVRRFLKLQIREIISIT